MTTHWQEQEGNMPMLRNRDYERLKKELFDELYKAIMNTLENEKTESDESADDEEDGET